MASYEIFSTVLIKLHCFIYYETAFVELLRQKPALDTQMIYMHDI